MVSGKCVLVSIGEKKGEGTCLATVTAILARIRPLRKDGWEANFESHSCSDTWLVIQPQNFLLL